MDIERIPKPWEGDRVKEVVGAGRLDKQKNFPLLIEAFAKFYKSHSDYVLKIYGDGPLREELIRYAESLLPKDAYCFPGRTTELLEKIKSASMFVLSSDYEGMPNVVIEAMAMGMPVISTDCPSGGSSYLIQNGNNGILTPVGEVDALSEAMCKVAESEKFAIKISREAEKIKNVLDAEVVAEKWREYLDEISKG
ncbi:glycosyltransferase [Fervidicella metallireducens]|uniref:glycosyltransferase n=1 Tax=Fervidicella metallireducens TaxID=655338 RepID=UPI0005569CFD|nr:glycosyltransferase [Fervidicella metallireducens]